MSKPLSFILQLTGLIIILINYDSLGGVLFGLLFVAIGGVGFRRRLKQPSS